MLTYDNAIFSDYVLLYGTIPIYFVAILPYNKYLWYTVIVYIVIW